MIKKSVKPQMNHKFYKKKNLVLLVLVLVVLISYKAQASSLKFYVVSNKVIPNSRYINTPEFPKLGFIGKKPILIIHKFDGVRKASVTEHSTHIKDDGTSEDWGTRTYECINISFSISDAKKFQNITEENIGNRILMMLDNKPLFAPRIYSIIKGQNISIRIPSGKVDALYKKLKTFEEK